MAEEHDDSVGHHTPTVRARETPSRDGDEDDGPTGQKICKACLTAQPDGDFCIRCGGELMEIRPAEDRYINDEVGGKYLLVEKIGQGGMGVVYKGVNEKLGQRVAVKFLSRKLADDESIVKRFLNEARSYCRVVHPNAVTLLDYGQHHDGTLYIITEFIDGKSLTDTLKSVGPLAPEEAIHVGLQVCEVLSAAHLEGVIHRDLKPDNLMLIPSSRGRYSVKVLDFGIAKIVDEEGGPNTETGSVFGTPEFMSPEQARGDNADPRSDLYALGIILFYMLTGKLPFKGKNKLVVLNKQLHADPPRPSEVRKGIDVPLRLEAVIGKLLNKDPAARYDSADDLAEALEELQVPGGLDTAKVGVKVSREESSPEIRLNTMRLGDLTEETDASDEVDEAGDPDPLGDTVAQFGDKFDDSMGPPPDLESIEMWREQPTGETSQVDPDSRRFALFAGGAVLLILALVAVVVMVAPSTPEPAPDGTRMESVLATGQVLGMLAAAEEMLAEGSITEASNSVEATEMWLSDDELPEKGRERRRLLRRQLGKVRTWSAQIESSLESGECSAARTTLKSVREVSPGLAEGLEPRVRGCEGGKAKVEPEAAGGAPSAPGEADAPANAPAEVPDVVEPTPAPAPASESQDVDEPPKSADESAPPPSKPSVEETLDKFEREQVDGADASPQDEADDAAEDVDTDKKPAEDVPGGMALPPKNVGDDAG